jgi:uncharacterized membrane protein
MLQTIFSNIMGFHFLMRWLHVLCGLMWIGILYYFNMVQGAFMAETQEAVAKSQVTQKLLPRALWWFRWGAMFTFLTGLIMLSIRAHLDVSAGGTGVFATPYWINILTGALFGTLMWFNVWFIIWPNQKVVIANAVAVAGGSPANPKAAGCGARALTASRTNTLFSAPMLFFMLAAQHLGYNISESSSVVLYWVLAAIIIFGLEANAMFGKTGPMTTIKGVITSGFVLTGVFLVLGSVVF